MGNLLSSPAELRDIARRMRAGASMGEIAKALGVSIYTVSVRAREYERVHGVRLPRMTVGRKPRPRGADPFQGRELPVVVAPGHACARCGLRGEHECIGSAENYARSGLPAGG